MTLQAKIIGGFGLALVLLLVVSFISFRSTGQLTEEAAWTEHTQEVMTRLAVLLSTVNDAETGGRGYTITGDATYLEPYLKAVAEVDTEFQTLRQITADNPRQQQRLDTLAPLLAKRMAVQREVIELRRDRGFAAAQDEIASGRGKQLHDAIRADVSEMRQEEESLLRQRRQIAEAAARRTKAYILGMCALATVILGLAFLRIRRSINEQKILEERTRHVVEAAPNAIVMVDAAGRITLANAQTENMFGYPRAELLGQLVEILVPEQFRAAHPQYRDGFFADPRPRAMGAGRDLFGLRKDGREVPVEIGLNPLVTSEGAFVLASIIDITERKRGEKLLRAKNEELKAFAYTVSHDLKAPLRGIAGYAQELERRHKEGLAERAQFCITQIITASKNLDALIEDLLKYSRLDTDIPTLAEVNLPELIQRILRDRTHTLAEMKAEVSINVPAITLRTWERGLNQALANLIDNAIKYSRNSQPPRLTISAEAAGGACRITVADNGIGFDMKYHDRIFGLFNRLVRADEFEGTGAGLAIVRKLMEKLGGSVRAESAPGQGAAFIVELPVSSAAEQAS